MSVSEEKMRKKERGGRLVDEANRATLNETLDFIPSLSVLSVSDLPHGLSPATSARLVRSLTVAGVFALPTRHAIVLNTFAGLNPDIDAELASLFRNHLPIGPFNLLNNDTMVNYNNGDYECLSWLNRHGPATVTYISFGTMMAPGRSGADLWGCHSMHMTTPRQYEYVVEMVCRPFFGEQKANARMVAEGWRIGVAIDSEGVAMREKVVNALKMVLREEEGGRMRERLGEIKKQAEKAVGDGGSSRENFRRVLEVICGDLDG
ncbi:uncharacterized protein A4U43_C01F34590 [Asparagus officinalis]|uniref:Uncharacterized protein n=1 Tax=Asparagus officinalis TaxID=4686 RepID=A0A5P1FXP5_ASPOF|nr:uncharacterized protein A4U43_C01F34590 [Asparagus officinalis]